MRASISEGDKGPPFAGREERGINCIAPGQIPEPSGDRIISHAWRSCPCCPSVGIAGGGGRIPLFFGYVLIDVGAGDFLATKVPSAEAMTDCFSSSLKGAPLAGN